mmetsp:Transcript_64681/g.115061  ORF Transcript_64681/g.115061 Transcript_64681/m.115061 type:complete len:496 (-) Transcript_64681:312-1799(-)
MLCSLCCNIEPASSSAKEVPAPRRRPSAGGSAPGGEPAEPTAARRPSQGNVERRPSVDTEAVSDSPQANPQRAPLGQARPDQESGEALPEVKEDDEAVMDRKNKRSSQKFTGKIDLEELAALEAETEKPSPERTPEARKRNNSITSVSSMSLPTGGLRDVVSEVNAMLKGLSQEVAVLGISKPIGAIVLPEKEFEEKNIVVSGAHDAVQARALLSKADIAFSCAKGRKPESPNQDNFFVAHSASFTLCCVADGHGKDGHWASHWAARFMLRLLLEEVENVRGLPSDEAIGKIFDMVHRELVSTAAFQSFDLSLSGTTMSVAVIDRDAKQLLMSWAGDSRIALGRNTRKKSLKVECVGESADHKPQDHDERMRVIASGGEVVLLPGDVPHRIFAKGTDRPGLAMSRAMGDVHAHSVGVIHVPGFLRLQFEPDDLLLCCSDGVWEFLATKQALEMVMGAGRPKVQQAVQTLVKESQELWLSECPDSTDDVSAIAIWL